MNTGTDHTADYKSLSLLTTTLIIGILLFSVISIVLHYVDALSNRFKDDSTAVFGVVLMISVIVVGATRVIYSKRIKVLKEENQSSKQKLDIFRSITITHMALCQFTALLSIVCFIVFGNFLFFLIVSMAIAEMFIKFPTRQRVESTVNSGTF